MATPASLKFTFTPADAAPPSGDNPHAKATTACADIAESLREAFGDDVHEVSEYAGETTVRVAAARIVDVCTHLRDAFAFSYLADLGGADRFTDDDRFEVFYNLVSIERQRRIRLVVRVSEEHPHVATVTGVWPGAGWHEREAWDMFGLRFDGHADLRRIYMPEDFDYHPLRKEFPLLGIPGSLPLPSNRSDGELSFDPFPAAHGNPTPASFEESAPTA